jgi:hypothetical protein
MVTQKKEKPVPVNYVYPKGVSHRSSSEAKLLSLTGATRISQTKTSDVFLQLSKADGLRKNVLFRISSYSVEMPYHEGYQSNYEPLWKIWLKQGCMFVSIIASSLYSLACYSQNAVHPNDIAESFMITHQADSVKQELCAEGFVVVKEAFMEMESQYEMPIVVPLNQGTLYQFVFIGDMTSTLYEVRMYDWEERQVVYQKKQWGDIDGNVISYSYIPQFSEYHMIKPVQVNKTKKQLYGYAILFKKIAP